MEQLDALAKNTSWFGPGSRIIITTRDKKLLESFKVTTIHEVRCLENEESLKMFKYFAFRGGVPPLDAYEGLAIRASRLAQGLPFAIVAFGLYLCRITSIEDWEDALVTFETAPEPRIMDVIRSSYINLDLRSKINFLKVACLFNGEPLLSVSALLAETETRIKTLADKSLIHISNDGIIEMHSLIQQVGREIVLEESMYIPRQQKMLWDPIKGYDVLRSNTVSVLRTTVFVFIPFLEELITKGCTKLENIPETIGYLTTLRKLDVSHCDCLMNHQMIIGELPGLTKDSPPIFRQVAVDIQYSEDTLNTLTDISIQGNLHFWLSHLRGNAAHLSFSSDHRTSANKTPGITSKYHGFKSLDIMRFNYKSYGASFKCYSFSNFPYLTELNLINLNIKSIPHDIDLLLELQKVDLSGNDFTDLPTEMKGLSKMKSLRLYNCCNLQYLPQLTQLETLKLSDCTYLRSLLDPSAAKINGSKYLLQQLWLNNCRSVQQLSDTLSHCTNLTYLDLRRNDIVTMPASIQLLPLLTTLYLNDCKKLKSLSQIPPHLTSLYASGCSSLETVYIPLDHSLKHFDLSYCPQLIGVEDLINRFLTRGRNEEVSQRFVCLPGSIVPSYFHNLATSLPQIPRTSKSVGFDVCIIISCKSPLHIRLSSSSYSCKHEDNGSYRINLKPDIFLPSESTSKEEPVSQHHMFIFHVPGSVDVHEFNLEPLLEFSEKFQSAPAKIISYEVRVIRKTQADDREHGISCGDQSAIKKSRRC